MSPEIFQQQILQWFDLNGRKNLPWQQDCSPYKTWLSEVMLQQTQVVTAIPYFNQFILQFPSIEHLAAADLDQVLMNWAGLGYYARARNLHKTAKIINEQGGSLPNDFNELLALPGIGRSTAGAILSIAFNNSHPILDGNVRRVLTRFHAISGWVGISKVSQVLWEISTKYTPKERCADYTQAMMDLGATLCTRSKPKCDQCPVNSHCTARLNDNVMAFPTPKPKKITPAKQVFFLVLQDEQQQFLLETRPSVGIWGGLRSFLEFNSITEAEDWCLQNHFPVLEKELLAEQRHTFSHYHLDYTPILIKTQNHINNVMEAGQPVWYKTEQISLLGLPAPIKKLFQNLY